MALIWEKRPSWKGKKSFREKRGKKKIWKLHRVSNKKKVNILSILLCPLSGLKENSQKNAACCYLQKILGPSCSNGAIHQINHYTADRVVCFANTYPLFIRWIALSSPWTTGTWRIIDAMAFICRKNMKRGHCLEVPLLLLFRPCTFPTCRGRESRQL